MQCCVSGNIWIELSPANQLRLVYERLGLAQGCIGCILVGAKNLVNAATERTAPEPMDITINLDVGLRQTICNNQLEVLLQIQRDSGHIICSLVVLLMSE